MLVRSSLQSVPKVSRLSLYDRADVTPASVLIFHGHIMPDLKFFGKCYQLDLSGAFMRELTIYLIFKVSAYLLVECS